MPKDSATKPGRMKKCMKSGKAMLPRKKKGTPQTKHTGVWARLARSPKWLFVTLTTLLASLAGAATHTEAIVNFFTKFFAPSHTSFIVQKASRDQIPVEITNTGGKSSTVQAYRLSFANMPIEGTALRLIDDNRPKSSIPPGEPVPARLTADGLRPDMKTGSLPFTKTEIKNLIPEGVAILEVDVQESNGFYTRCVEFDASLIKAFIEAKVPDYEHH